MAKIFLRARLPIAIDNEKAKQLKEQWIAGTLPVMIDTESESFKSRDISGFGEIFGEDNTGKRYDLDNPVQVEIIKQFEKDFKGYLKEHSTLCNWKDRTFIHLLWFQELGAIKIKGDTNKKPTSDNVWIANYSVVDPILFTELQKKWSAFNELRWRREMAKKREKEAIESVVPVF